MADFPLYLTFKLALTTTVFLLVLSLPISYLLAHSKSKLKPLFEAFISLPLVLPPTVLGFYILIFLGPNHVVGKWLHETFNLQLVFSFEGLVFASIIYSLPFMVHPLQAGFVKVPKSIIEASYVLGKSKVNTLYKVVLPNMKPAIITGVVLSFAHTIGEFGVVLMIGGNLPGETKVASIAIYDYVEAMNYEAANTYALVLLAISFTVLFLVYFFNHKRETNITL